MINLKNESKLNDKQVAKLIAEEVYYPSIKNKK